MGQAKGGFLQNTFCGLFLCLISSLVLSGGTMLVSTMAQYHPITKSFWRFLGTFIPGLFVVLYYVITKGKSVFEVLWPATFKDGFQIHMSLMLRSLFGCSAGTLQYYSLKFLPLGDSAVICNCYPVFVAILAKVLLGETFGLWMLGSTVITLTGVVITTQPPFLSGEEMHKSSYYWSSPCIQLSSKHGLCYSHDSSSQENSSFHQLGILRRLDSRNGFGWGTVESCILAAGFGVFKFPETGFDLGIAVSVGLLSCLSQILLIFALRCDNAGPVSLVKTSDVLFAFIWQFGVYSQTPSILSLIGAGVMLIGIGLAGFRRYVDSFEEMSPMRLRFWFVLK